MGGRMTKNRVIALLLPLTLIFVASCSLDVELPRQYAVVYGVADYGPVISNLWYTDNDAVAVRDLLESRGYEVVFRLSSDVESYPEESTEALPTRDQLVADLEEAARTLDEDDSFLFYFSGHGGRIGDFAPAHVPDTSEPFGHAEVAEYLALYNDIGSELIGGYSWYGATIDPDEFPRVSVKDDELAELIRAIPARAKTIVIDACNSGGIIGTSTAFDTYPQDYDGSTQVRGSDARRAALELFFSAPGAADVDVTYKDAVVLAAAGADELAYEPKKQVAGPEGHGFFTELFLAGADHGDINDDGYITTSEMYRYVTTYIDEVHNNQDMDPGSSPSTWNYRPRISGGAIDLVLFPTE